MGLVEAGKITLKEGAEKIGMSYRLAKRIRKRVQEKEMKGLIHGNTGKPSNHRMKEGIKAKVGPYLPDELAALPGVGATSLLPNTWVVVFMVFCLSLGL